MNRLFPQHNLIQQSAPLFLLYLVIANAFAGSVTILVMTGALNLQAAEILAVCIALSMIGRARIDAIRLSWFSFSVMAVIALLLLLPSAKAAWIALAMLSFWLASACRLQVRQRAGLYLLAVLGLRSPASGLSFDLLAEPLLFVDTWIAALLAGVTGDISMTGSNILSNNGHDLVIMSGCSSFDNVTQALLAWYAVALYHDLATRRIVTGCLPVILVVMLCNAVRITLLLQSPDSYHVYHADMAVFVFDMVQMVAVAVCIILAVMLSSRGKRDAVA